MKRITIFVMLVSLPLLGFAQSLTLDECKKMAHDNYPAIKQYNMVENLRNYTVSNAAKGWLPQISVQAGAYAFTDFIDISNPKGFDTKNFLASGTITVKQNIYDGGQIAAGKKVAKAQAEVQKNQLDVTMHEINERVEQLFFGVLTIEEQLHQNNILQQDLSVSSATVKSMMSNGIANQNDMDAVNVEQIKAEQQAEALSTSRKAYLKMLGIFIGKPLDENAKIEKPVMTLPTPKETWSLQRPELSYYASQNQLLDTQRKQLNTRLRPTMGLMGMGLLHTNIVDIMKHNTLIGGISVSWNIGALYTRKNDIHKLEVQKQQNDNLRETFLFNNRLQNEDTDGNIQALRKQLEKDDQIVTLRENIRQANEKKVKLGTETVNELIRSINAVNMAKQQKSLHELQLLQAIYHSKTINN